MEAVKSKFGGPGSNLTGATLPQKCVGSSDNTQYDTPMDTPKWFEMGERCR